MKVFLGLAVTVSFDFVNDNNGGGRGADKLKVVWICGDGGVNGAPNTLTGEHSE